MPHSKSVYADWIEDSRFNWLPDKLQIVANELVQ